LTPDRTGERVAEAAADGAREELADIEADALDDDRRARIVEGIEQDVSGAVARNVVLLGLADRGPV